MKLYFKDKRVREIFETEENKSEDEKKKSEHEKNKSVQSEEDAIKAALNSLGAQDTIISRATDLYSKTIKSEEQNTDVGQETPQDSSTLDAKAANTKEKASGAADFNKELPRSGTV